MLPICQLELDPNLPLINCSIDEINQVILNLIVNSAQAIEEVIGRDPSQKGMIKIETINKEDSIEIKISDTGIGISKDKISRIFEPFFTTKEVGKGTGQGLTIAHDIIVNKHHGEITVSSMPGKGATFKVILPVK